MTIFKSKWLISSILIFMMISTTFILTYAYYVNQQTKGILLDSGSFEVTVLAAFDDVEITLNSPYYDVASQIILVNAYDPNSANYIGKLTISVEIRPEIAARLRIQVQDEWELTRTFLDEEGNPTFPVSESVYQTEKNAGYYPFSLLKTSSSFIPIYGSDGYAYLDEVMLKNTLYHFDIIAGGDPYPVRTNDLYIETCMVRLGLIIDVIQANRYMELWGLEETFYN